MECLLDYVPLMFVIVAAKLLEDCKCGCKYKNIVYMLVIII